MVMVSVGRQQKIYKFTIVFCDQMTYSLEVKYFYTCVQCFEMAQSSTRGGISGLGFLCFVLHNDNSMDITEL